MKKSKTRNILLTVLAVVLLVAFAAAVNSPRLTDEAYEAHMDMMWN